MSLEKRIADALHAADTFQPSPDLFTRLQRSIEEDLAHRRRVRIAVGLLVVGLVIVVWFLAAVAEKSPDGVTTVPKWSVQAVAAVVLITVLVTLGPVLRRLGSPLLENVFYLNPATGQRFARLLDIAYYLFFGGLIVNSVDTRGLTEHVGASSEEVWTGMARIAGFLTQLGVVHTINLALLPVIGLLFTSLTRRAKRRAAGAEAPESPHARRADRLALGIVVTATAVAVAATLALVAVVLVSITLS